MRCGKYQDPKCLITGYIAGFKDGKPCDADFLKCEIPENCKAKQEAVESFLVELVGVCKLNTIPEKKEIMKELGKYFEGKGVPKSHIVMKDGIHSQIYDDIVKALEPVFSGCMGPGEIFAACAIKGHMAYHIEDLLDEWVPIFQRFEPNP